MRHCLILFDHYLKNLKISWKIFWHKINLMIMINSYFSLKLITFTNGNKKSNINIHGILKSQWLFILRN